MNRLELALLPAEASALEADAYLVVDVLRATTTIAALFAGGLRDLVVVDDIDSARQRAREEGRLLAGEVDGRQPEGFDLGNSPVEARAADIGGRGAVLFTTSGTAALCGAAAMGPVAAGALANLSAAAAWLTGWERGTVICAGLKGGKEFGLDDFAAAGAILREAARLSPGAELGDAAGLAVESLGFDGWIEAGMARNLAPARRLISGSRHARYLTSIGLAADVQFALQVDSCPVLPLVVEHGPGWTRLEAVSPVQGRP